MAKSFKTRLKKKAASSAFSVRWLAALKGLVMSLLPYVLSLTVVGVIFGSVVAYALNSPVFQLEEVKILNAGTWTQQQAFQFCELRRGENLIQLDLVGVQQVIKRRHPEFKDVRVRRVLPNSVEVILKRRTPAAQVAYARFVQIDRDFLILPGSSPTPFKNLTIIEGAPVPRRGLLVGVTIDDVWTRKALKIMELVKQSKILRKHVLSKIDIRDPKSISLFVDSDIEIKMGRDHLMEKLQLLDQTLKSVELDASKIRYIDLRFDDVVVGPR